MMSLKQAIREVTETMRLEVLVGKAFHSELSMSESFDSADPDEYPNDPLGSGPWDEERIALWRDWYRDGKPSGTRVRVRLSPAAARYLMDPLVLPYHRDKWSEWARWDEHPGARSFLRSALRLEDTIRRSGIVR